MWLTLTFLNYAVISSFNLQINIPGNLFHCAIIKLTLTVHANRANKLQPSITKTPTKYERYNKLAYYSD